MRKRYIADGPHWREIGADYEPDGPSGPFVIGEIEAYQSPIDGSVIDSRAKRREDLKRSGSRPWEGLQAEKKEAARIQSQEREKFNKTIEAGIWKSYYQLDPKKRRILRGAT